MSTVETRQKIVYWRGVVNKLNDSTLSVGEFSKKNKISASKLSYWKLRIKQLEPHHFIEVKNVSTPELKNEVTLSIDNVITINFSRPPSPEWISELISNVRTVA